MANVTKPMALDETLQATNTILQGIGLSNIGNMSALTTIDKTSLVGAVNELNGGKVSNSEVGVANGVAELDSTGKVPSSQLPAFVDDVIEGYFYNSEFYYDSAHTQLITPESGKIYVDLVSNKTYRWGGSAYVVISDTLALGETSTTAYRGDRGKTAYDHSQDASRITSAIAEGLYKVGGTAQGHISSMTAVQKADLTALGVADDADVEAIEDKIDVSLESVSGNPISISGLKSSQLALNPVITYNPIQDLHGQSKPYPAGGGKNKLLLSTQSGTYGDVVTTVNSDGTILCNGTASAEVNITLYNGTLPSGTYRINGNPSGASSTTYRMRYRVNSGSWNYISSETSDPDVTLTSTDILELRILIASGVQVSNKLWKPMIRLATETDSTFAPYSNICPISGYDKIEVLSCGKNLFDGTKATDGKRITTDGTLIDGSAYSASDYISVKPNTAYYLSHVIGISAWYTSALYTKNKDFIELKDIPGSSDASGYITTSANAAYIRINVLTANKNTVQIEEGNQATTYEPYHKTTDLSESLGQTVYGGTLDVRTGLFTVTHNIVDLGDRVWTKSGTEGLFLSYNPQSSINLKMSPDSVTPMNAVCSHYAIETYSNHSDKSVFDTWATAASKYIAVLDSDYANADATAFRAAMSGVKLCYEVNEPTEIQLTPHEIALSQGYAYLSTNGTLIALDYHNGEMARLSDVELLNETIENQFTLFNSKQFKYVDGVIKRNTTVTLDVPKAYLLVTYATVGAALGVVIGNGYGKESSRHKFTQLIQVGTGLAFGQNTEKLGLVVTSTFSEVDVSYRLYTLVE